MVVRLCLALVAGLLFSSCAYLIHIPRVLVTGVIEADILNIGDYSLAYYVDSKEVDFDAIFHDYYGHDITNVPFDTYNMLKLGSIYFCSNSLVYCGKKLYQKAEFTIYLKEHKSKQMLLVGQKMTHINKILQTELITNVYIGSDTTQILKRHGGHLNFDWDKVQKSYSEELKDTIYYYTSTRYRINKYGNVPYIDAELLDF